MSKARRTKPVYLVSADANIKPSDEVLRRTGRRVRYGAEVDKEAAIAMKPGGRFVVVAHGRDDGTVMWLGGDDDRPGRWLWIGMRKPPKESEVYLYSCRAGKKLPRHLKHCKCLGHVDVVPSPLGGRKDVVIGFLDEVDRVMRISTSPVEWHQGLVAYVDSLYVKAVERSATLGYFLPLLILRKSLGAPSD